MIRMPVVSKNINKQNVWSEDEFSRPGRRRVAIGGFRTCKIKNVDWNAYTKAKGILRKWNYVRGQLSDEKLNTTTLREFKYLSDKWKKETNGLSLIHQITKNKNYKYIIDMGEKVVPLIFKDLQNEPFYWFEALNQILTPTQDPILKDHYGDLDKMAEDWLNWAKKNQYIK
jgi:hypothetical protein